MEIDDAGAVPSAFTYGYVHRAKVSCRSCEGTGKIGSIDCGACLGFGEYTVGCGGDAGVDDKHPGLGADCLRCGFQVPLEEVSSR